MSISDLDPGLSFLLVRSGSTELDQQGRIVGCLDLPLCVDGKAEMSRTADEIKHLPLTIIYSADCQSAQQSAEILGEQLRLKVRTVPNLSNLDCGLWHGKSLEELRETQPTLFRQWRDHPESVCIPQGEPIENLKQRVKAAIQKVRKKHRQGFIVVVAPDPLLGFFRRELQSAGDTDSASHCQPKPIPWEVIQSPVLMPHNGG